MKRRPQLVRFMESVMPVTESGCWFWMLSVHPTGYGHSSYRGQSIQAHRLSWLLHRGRIPKGVHVLHHCDIPCCVNPDHLFLGTPADNARDKSRKGRTVRRFGVENPAAKLNPDIVRAIRASTEPLKTLSARYGVGIPAIWKARTGATWRAEKHAGTANNTAAPALAT